MTTMHGQDWTPITFATRAPLSTTNGNTAKSGTPHKRHAAVSVTNVGLSARKLNDETEELRHATVSTDLRTALQKARQAKGLTQKGLAVMLNVDAKLVAEYEAGKGIPNNGVIARMEKALGAKLPRVAKQR